MSDFAIGLLGFGGLFGLMLAGIPIAVAMALVGLLGTAYVSDWTAAFAVMKLGPFDQASSASLGVIPLYLLMAFAAARSGMSRGLFRMAEAWLGHLRGGLAMATVGACAGFSAISGSSIATASAMASIAHPEMMRARYAPGLSAATIAAGATLGIIIPPSVIFVLYGIVTEQSIGRLLMAGVVPGLIEIVLFLGAIAIIVRRSKDAAPVPAAKASLGARLRSLAALWDAAVLFTIVIGGIYFGIVTPVESAALGAVAAVVMGFARRTLGLRGLRDALLESVTVAAMIFLIIIGADLFGTFVALTQIPTKLAEVIADLNVPRAVVLWLIVAIFLVLGALMDELSMILLTMPVFFPLVTGLGYDPIWFGVIVVIAAQMGMLNPPMGINVFIVAGAVPDARIDDIYRRVMPFVAAQLVLIAILAIWPSLALFLPARMF
jgi:tripartite ATP-independent transporter DctM subunit